LTNATLKHWNIVTCNPWFVIGKNQSPVTSYPSLMITFPKL